MKRGRGAEDAVPAAPGEDGRVRRGQETREARRAQIKATALEVFSRRGYHQTSVSDLVDAAGVARGTFYLYFDSKEAIFLELLEDLLGHVRTTVVGIDPRAPMEGQLHLVVAGILTTLVHNRPLTRIIFREAVGLYAEVDERLHAFDDELHGWVARSLELGARLGKARAVDPQVGAMCVVGSLREVVLRLVVAADEPFDVERVANALVDYHLGGLGPPR